MDAQQTRIYTAIIITSVIFGVILIYFIVSVIRQQRKIVQLNRQNILAEITQMEKDRSRIATDLHDDLGPLLAAVKMRIGSLDTQNANDRIIIEKTNDHIDEILKRIREISFDLMPASLLRKGVIVAIHEFVDYLNNAGKIKFYFKADDKVNLSEQISIHLYRIVQEVLHNTIKHSQAKEVNIELRKIKNNLHMVISDNGLGFDHNADLKENHGFGLRSLLSRTKLMEGKMFLESETGKGTTYTFELPV